VRSKPFCQDNSLFTGCGLGYHTQVVLK